MTIFINNLTQVDNTSLSPIQTEGDGTVTVNPGSDDTCCASLARMTVRDLKPLPHNRQNTVRKPLFGSNCHLAEIVFSFTSNHLSCYRGPFYIPSDTLTRTRPSECPKFYTTMMSDEKQFTPKRA